MIVKPMVLALWSAYGTMQTHPLAAWRLMRFKRKADGKERWAAVTPYVWGAWHG